MLTTEIIRDQDECIEQLIENEQIVAIYQGHSEWGPRALGNRSILFDPRNPDARRLLTRLKKESGIDLLQARYYQNIQMIIFIC